MSQKYSVVLTTTGSQQEANRLSELLVREKLAACVQSLPITSTYTWDGHLTQDSEWLLLIKTRSEIFKELESFILANHSYDTPEIIQLPVEAGYSGYLAWVEENTA
jgi:periplasmic divalent cation tolerance protein